MSNIDELPRDRILFIGEQVPESLATDSNPKYILSGVPQELLDDIKSLIKEARIDELEKLKKQPSYYTRTAVDDRLAQLKGDKE